MHVTSNLPLFFKGVHYDLKWRHFTADLEFWTRMAGRYGGRVLDLACGTGRLPIHLTRAGFRVTGVDSSEALLREASRKCLRLRLAVQWVHRDIRRFDLGARFPLVIFPSNAISSLMEIRDLEACLACVKRHLGPKGKFIIDAENPHLDLLSRPPDQRFPHKRYPAPNGNGLVEVTATNDYDSSRQINHLRLYHQMPDEGGEFVEELKVRVYFPQELNALLKYNGFLIETKYGDYNEGAFDSASQQHIVVSSVPG
ncbi:MAG TPA: class I SAM-dependent methyltransferase [Terriglobia bacterium]|nr:class I SAM-dependent methyltransferase [Terriglobia bacterium]